MTNLSASEDSATVVGIVAAYRAEIAPLLHRTQSMRSGVKGDLRVRLPLGTAALAISGAGAGNARRASRWLASRHRLSALISIGFAGGLIGEAMPGSVVIASHVVEAATGTVFACAAELLRGVSGPRGTVVTVPAVARTRQEKAALHALWQANAADMEAAAVAAEARAMGLPFGALKAITDGPADELAIDFQRCLNANGGLSSVKIVFEGLRGLGQFRSLLLLARNSRAAAGSLATALALE